MLKRTKYLISQFTAMRAYKCRVAPLWRFPQYLKEFGLGGGISFCSAVLLRKGAYSVTLPGIKGQLHMRLGTSDVPTFLKIFFKREYDFPLGIKPRLIIDAGANVGYSAVFFASKYPQAEIIALEPEDTNFALLERNAAPYPNIRPLKGGLWSGSTNLRIVNLERADKAGYMVEEAGPGEKGAFRSYTVSELLKRSEHRSIDLLKLDIEGAEREVFSRGAEAWVGKVKAMFIELHDYMVPGCREALEGAVAGQGFTTLKKGENVVLVRSSLLRG